MPTTIATKAVEGSTYVVTAAFTDEDGDTVVPATVTWTLTDISGNVVNNREDVALTPAISVDIVMYGDDLKISTYGMERVLTIRLVLHMVVIYLLPIL